jgi:hypothetical protein
MTNQVATKPTQDVAETPQSSGTTPMQMLEMAIQRGADMDQLTKLMDLQERWEANQARKEFVAALNAFKADPPQITKNKKVDFSTSKGRTQYEHATLDHICEQIAPALAKHGLSHRWRIEQAENTQAIKVTCVLTHERGHTEEVTMHAWPDDSGNKNKIQQVGSTTTYLQRYTLLAATGLAAAEHDDDGRKADPSAVPIRSDQKKVLDDLIAQTGADVDRFCQYLGVDQVADITVGQFDRAKRVLEAKWKQQQAKAQDTGGSE